MLHRLEKSHFDDDDEKCKRKQYISESKPLVHIPHSCNNKLFLTGELKHLMAKQEALLEAGKTQAVEVAPLIVTLMSDLSGSCLEIAETFYAKLVIDLETC